MKTEVERENVHARGEDGIVDMAEAVEDAPEPTGFDALEAEAATAVGGDREMIWRLDRDDNNDQNLLDVTVDASIFYNDLFPSLPDFSCMSSSSSSSPSSSAPAPANPIPPSSTSSTASCSSSSSSTSWTADRGAGEMGPPPAALSSTASMELILPPADNENGVDCMDVMENFGYLDLIDDSNEIWDPSSIFQNENHQEFLMSTQNDDESHKDQPIQQQQQQQQQFVPETNNNSSEEAAAEGEKSIDELGVVFFEWLKSNKDNISADDMRSIKLKRATIECASKRLGSTKEGKKQLLKLILEWVANYQLQKKRMREADPESPFQYNLEPLQNPNPNTCLNCASVSQLPNTCFSPSPWIQHQPQQPYVSNAAAVMAAPIPGFPAMGGYMVDPYSSAASYAPSSEYPVMDPTQSWSAPQFALGSSQYRPFPDSGHQLVQATNQQPPPLTGYGSQYPYPIYNNGNSERLVGLGSSATKEARKKRMARQRRISSHHNRNQNNDQHARLGGGADNCTNTGLGPVPGQANPSNWVYWQPPVAPTVPPLVPGDSPERSARQTTSDRRQGWKVEKNLKFLLQKVLKQSDVGNHGRIVLPKKEAETHLPELEARDGIPIAMEDIGTSRVWNMRYRFWPNNKSRMYLLENTGDFVRANGLQEGDFIVIYSDTKWGKYLIRGVKVRQHGPKSEGKKPPRKTPRNSSSPLAGNESSSYSPTKQAEAPAAAAAAVLK